MAESQSTGDIYQDLMNAVTSRIDDGKKAVDSVEKVLEARKADEAALEQVTRAGGISDGQGGYNTPMSIAAQEAAKLRNQEKVVNIATTMGTNPDVASNILSSLSAQFQDATNKAAEADKVVYEKSSSKFLDNPFKYAWDQLTLPGAQETSDAANRYRDNSYKALQEAQSLTQEMPKTVAATAQVATAASAQSKVDAFKAQVDEAALRVKLNNSALDIQGIMQVQQMKGEQLSALGQAYSAENAKKHLAISQASLALQTKQAQLVMEDRAERLAQKKLDNEGQQQIVDWVISGAAQYGVDIAKLPPSKIITMINSKADPNFDIYMKAGILKDSTGKPIFSDNAGEAATNLVRTNAPLPPIYSTVKNLLLGAFGEATDPSKAAQTKVTDFKDASQVKRATAQVAVNAANNYAKDVEAGTNVNIYAPLALPDIAKIPAIAETQLFKTVLAPQIDIGGLKEFKGEQLVSLTTEAIKSGKIDYKTAAADLQKTFASVAIANNAAKNFEGFGLPKQVSYNTKIHTTTYLPKTYNLMDPKDIDRVLNLKLKQGTWNNVQQSTFNPYGGAAF